RAQYRESIEVMNTPELNPTHFSISFWLKPTVIEPYGHVVSHSNRAQTAGWQFDTFSTSGPGGVPTSTLRFGVFNSNGTLFSPADIMLSSDTMIHVTGTFDGRMLRIYENGALVGETEFRGTYMADPGVPLRVGSAAYCSSCNRWSGVLDDLRMYNRTLTAEEVAQLGRMEEVSSDLVLHLKFDGNTEDALGRNGGTSTTMLGGMAFAPDGRLFFTEKNSGAIRIMTPDHKVLEEPFAQVQDVYVSWEQGLLGIAIDPDFEHNHYVYVYYSALVNNENGDGSKVVNRVVRFTDVNNTGTGMKVIMDNIPASRGFHSGGAMAFGPDGKLYITVGDATEHIFAQDPSIALGKVLRINKDGTIPEDNPYPNLPVYTIGHRNMYGIAFDNSSGTGLITENGDFRYDEINIIEKGGNYGFPTLQPPNLPPERADNTSIKPVRSYWDTIAPTNMIYYTGDAVPELKGMFLFGTFTGDIYALKLSEDNKRVVEEIKIDLAHFPFVPTVGIAQSPDGKIYYGGYQIYTLDSIDEMEQMLFPIYIEAPAALDVAEVNVDESKGEVTINAGVNGTITPDATLTARIPTALIEDITTVTLGSQGGRSTDFAINSSDANFTSIRIDIASALADSELRLSILGTTRAAAVAPEFPVATFIAASALAITLTAAALALRKIKGS
ncbi:MAG TPA: PQQ-dependent sugar dehydrogenase, partial [Nitrososphaera sp.]|nr:PQQ-dependent sugar dehydrogenase [Nitrososphaera sp.]